MDDELEAPNSVLHIIMLFAFICIYRCFWKPLSSQQGLKAKIKMHLINFISKFLR